jgi:hypothetical protein
VEKRSWHSQQLKQVQSHQVTGKLIVVRRRNQAVRKGTTGKKVKASVER